MINAVIFDMDGVLIDSEPFWQESEIAAFGKVGLQLTRSMCLETMGLRVDEVVEYWRKKRGWEYCPTEELEELIVSGVIDRILARGEAKEGVEHAMASFKRHGVKMALASSSAYRIIRAVLDRFKLADKFDCIYSAEEEEYGKPHPGVYLTTARKLGVGPAECLAIEDSFNGVLSAKAARMKCIAIPDAAARCDPRFVIADLTLDTLADVSEEVWDRLNR